eukprot:9039427-Heterocapsa_arctica.AAC.1
MGEHGVIPAEFPPPPFPPPMEAQLVARNALPYPSPMAWPGEHEVILTAPRSAAFIGEMLPPPPNMPPVQEVTGATALSSRTLGTYSKRPSKHTLQAPMRRSGNWSHVDVVGFEGMT